MDILNNTNQNNSVQKSEIEQVQKQKQEYKHIGQYLRTRSLKLFSYNPRTEEIKEIVDIKKVDVEIISTETGLSTKDLATAKASIDTRNIQFESLNMGNAEKRVKKWKEGKIKELFNLREKPTDFKL